MKQATIRCAVATLVVMALLPVRVSVAADVVVIKFSHVVAADAPKGKMAEKFRQLAEER